VTWLVVVTIKVAVCPAYNRSTSIICCLPYS